MSGFEAAIPMADDLADDALDPHQQRILNMFHRRTVDSANAQSMDTGAPPPVPQFEDAQLVNTGNSMASLDAVIKSQKLELLALRTQLAQSGPQSWAPVPYIYPGTGNTVGTNTTLTPTQTSNNGHLAESADPVHDSMDTSGPQELAG